VTDHCPHCGGLIRGDEDQVARWRLECAQNNLPLKRGRVDERTAADLLGVSARFLAERRKRGCGPVVEILPVAGSRYAYSLESLARFKDAHSSGEDWE
jgi:hypothetical protein